MPMFCSSLPHYETTLVFGRTLLRSIFRSESKKLLDRCQADKDKFTDEQKILFLHLPKYSYTLIWNTNPLFGRASLFLNLVSFLFEIRFLTALEDDVFADNSPIWDTEFKRNPPSHLFANFDRSNLAYILNFEYCFFLQIIELIF